MNRQVRIALASIVAGWFALASPQGAISATAAEINYQGMWWNAPAASESGWGINFAHQGDTIFATWFTFGADGNPLWLVVAVTRTAGNIYTGDIYSGTGPPYNVVPFNPALVMPSKVGTATLTFTDGNSATFAYTVNGISQSKNITREVFSDPVPTCVWGGPANAAAATNFQDMWWGAPSGSESGWGINFAHQGDTLFATWFTYGTDGKPLWLVVGANRTASNIYAGTVYTGTGPPFSAVPFDPAKVNATPVGTATFTFTDGNNAVFAYTVNGLSQAKPITRQIFGTAGTVCSAPLSAADKRRDAARFLRQATFGATREAIDALAVQGYDAWLEDQFAKPVISHLATVKADPILPYSGVEPSQWAQYFVGDDQLRQRVGAALLQIFVVSKNNMVVQGAPCGLAAYLDILNRGAFGNLRDLLREVTLSPVMGEYLSMKQSAKADPVLQTQPDENYAREVMQLFSVGLVMLNDDGSVRLDPDGKPVPTYNEDTVKGFAKALSGWTHSGIDQSQPKLWLVAPGDGAPDPTTYAQSACPGWSTPMAPWNADYIASDNQRVIAGPAHDTGAKQLLVYAGAPYSALPAGQSAQTDLDNVLDNLFFHPNVGPFLGKQLIQRLVTSNPSPEYIARVAAKFNDNGNGVRGDMKAVVRAVLLDNDARSLLVASQRGFGKLTEPVVRFVQFFRAFNARRADGYYDLPGLFLRDPTALNQAPLFSPSVFNFYHPDFTPAGPLAKAGLVGPEFEITNTSSVAGFSQFSSDFMLPGFRYGSNDDSKWLRPDYTYYLTLTDTPAQLIESLESVLCAGCLDPVLRTKFADAVGTFPSSAVPSGATPNSVVRLNVALWLIINSPDYLVQK